MGTNIRLFRTKSWARLTWNDRCEVCNCKVGESQPGSQPLLTTRVELNVLRTQGKANPKDMGSKGTPQRENWEFLNQKTNGLDQRNVYRH